jgi:myo-inositol-1(or 4)-monophosphatase
MSAFLQAAVQAARAAGAIQRRFYGKPLNIELKEGNSLNLVTQVDKLCEKTALSLLKRRFPSHGLWGEESGGAPRARGFTWVVDPLDGTTNFTHGYPFFCCSVALLKDGRPVAAAVHDELRKETFSAEQGAGAALNGRRIRVSPTASLSKALLCTGFAYHVHETGYNLENFKRFILKSQGVRRDGSAALNLSYVAAGRFDGFWERGIQAWDMAAGVLLVREAGGTVTDVTGSPYDLLKQNVLATNGGLHPAMLEILSDSPDEKNFLKALKTKKPSAAPIPNPPMELPLFNKPSKNKKR